MTTKKNLVRVLRAELHDFGFRAVTEAMVAEILEAWLAGDRGVYLPYSFIGAFAGHLLDEVERQEPDMLAGLK